MHNRMGAGGDGGMHNRMGAGGGAERNVFQTGGLGDSPGGLLSSVVRAVAVAICIPV